MAENVKMVCPVCGGYRQSETGSGCACTGCGFKSAFVTIFLNEQSLLLWKEQVGKEKKGLLRERRRKFAQSGCFSMGGRAMALRLSDPGTLYVIRSDGDFSELGNADGFSSSERHYSVLYKDGKVGGFGDDESNFGLLRTQDWREIREVVSAPNCTYGVTKEGTVLSAGVSLYPQVKDWRGIRKLYCDTTHILGLTEDGLVKAAGSFPDPSNLPAVQKWKEIRDLAVSGGASLALHKNGKVSFAGKQGDPRYAVESWENICAIAMDNTYAVGLTAEGKVLLAGRCKKFLDKGRSEAAAWDHVIAVSCRQAGIGAVTESGDLLYAGTFPGDFDRIRKIWNERIKDNIKLMTE